MICHFDTLNTACFDFGVHAQNQYCKGFALQNKNLAIEQSKNTIKILMTGHFCFIQQAL